MLKEFMIRSTVMVGAIVIANTVIEKLEKKSLKRDIAKKKSEEEKKDEKVEA